MKSNCLGRITSGADFGVLVAFLLVLMMAGGRAPAQAEQKASSTPRQTLRVEVERVVVPVVVIGEDGRLFADLKRENFQILEEGQPQEITSFSGEASPLTVVLLLEYSNRIRYLRGEVIRPAGVFVSQVMKPEDYVAIIAFDTRPRLLSDFTQNRQLLLDAVNDLVQSPPLMSESNLYDALQFTLQGGMLEEVEYKGLAEVTGRTGVILAASGMDTFSGITFDDIRRIVARAGVPIYSIGIGELAFIRAEPYLSGAQRLDFLQGQNTLRTFSESSGGRFYSVRFSAALDSVLESIAAMLRHQYTLAYKPARPLQKGEQRKIKVLVDVDGDGQPDNERLDVQYRQSYAAGEGG